MGDRNANRGEDYISPHLNFFYKFRFSFNSHLQVLIEIIWVAVVHVEPRHWLYRHSKKSNEAYFEAEASEAAAD